MKKAYVFLGAALLLAGNARADGVEALLAGVFQRQPAAVEAVKAQNSASMKALCKEVDVALDEGYGVSSHETRVVCAQEP
jgi:hypothetical protein